MNQIIIIIIMVTENKNNQSFSRAQLMLCKSILFVTNWGAMKKRNIGWPKPCRKVLLSKEIQQICANMCKHVQLEMPPSDTSIEKSIWTKTSKWKNLEEDQHTVIRLLYCILYQSTICFGTLLDDWAQAIANASRTELFLLPNRQSSLQTAGKLSTINEKNCPVSL